MATILVGQLATPKLLVLSGPDSLMVYVPSFADVTHSPETKNRHEMYASGAIAVVNGKAHFTAI